MHVLSVCVHRHKCLCNSVSWGSYVLFVLVYTFMQACMHACIYRETLDHIRITDKFV